MKKYLKEHWIFLLLCVVFPIFSISQGQDSLRKILLYLFVYLFVFPVCHYIFIKKLGFNKTGPIPIYQSPIFWVGIPVLMVLFYVFV
jgi:uncharacterized membrane protein